jgi:hypothetical protein
MKNEVNGKYFLGNENEHDNTRRYEKEFSIKQIVGECLESSNSASFSAS